MAQLTGDQVVAVYSNGACGHTVLFAVKNATAGDTLDLIEHFKFVKRAGVVGDTGSTIAACSISAPTGLTIPTGPSNDGLWLLVVGVAV